MKPLRAGDRIQLKTKDNTGWRGKGTVVSLDGGDVCFRQDGTGMLCMACLHEVERLDRRDKIAEAQVRLPPPSPAPWPSGTMVLVAIYPRKAIPPEPGKHHGCKSRHELCGAISDTLTIEQVEHFGSVQINKVWYRWPWAVAYRLGFVATQTTDGRLAVDVYDPQYEPQPPFYRLDLFSPTDVVALYVPCKDIHLEMPINRTWPPTAVLALIQQQEMRNDRQ